MMELYIIERNTMNLTYMAHNFCIGKSSHPLVTEFLKKGECDALLHDHKEEHS